MELTDLYKGQYKGKKILVTGHTGFKGSWLALWLKKMGALVIGISLEPNTEPNHFDLLGLDYKSYIQNINDKDAINLLFKEVAPDLIFHLAAQPLVRLSYEDPYNTFLTNIMGTVNILEAARNIESLKGVVVITSDKCYENREWIWGYRENEPMGGKDPYSSSKGCAELVTAAYRDSYFSNRDKANSALIASVRAGNVIGGGDWAKDRILPDIVKAAKAKTPLFLRNPNATRPWQHVLEPLSGYLNIGQKLLEGNKDFEGAWNFGPNNESNVSVKELVVEATNHWGEVEFEIDSNEHPQEANFLMLDSSKATRFLGWRPVWNFEETVEYTIEWYKKYYSNREVISENQLSIYIRDAIMKKVEWAIK